MSRMYDDFMIEIITSIFYDRIFGLLDFGAFLTKNLGTILNKMLCE